ncbi:hypothetical protein [Methanothrix sp.]|nr:hypothetical protein [Methanothrix sp.]
MEDRRILNGIHKNYEYGDWASLQQEAFRRLGLPITLNKMAFV